jgi:hypothetical protein
MNKAQLTAIPNCDICEGMGLKTKATFDGPTVFGPWAYMCESCFFEQGSPKISSVLELA